MVEGSSDLEVYEARKGGTPPPPTAVPPLPMLRIGRISEGYFLHGPNHRPTLLLLIFMLIRPLIATLEFTLNAFAV